MNRRQPVGESAAATAARAATVPTARAAAISKLLESSNRPVCEAFDDLVAFVHSAVPEATAKVNPGWRSLNFSHARVGYFCGLFPFEDHLRVVFEFGVLLPDPAGLFDDRQKQIASITIRRRRDIRRRALRRMLLDAIALPADRATRLALVRAKAQPKRS